MPAINDSVAYRSMGGDVWDAIVTRIRDADFIDITVSGPTLKEPMELHAVRWRDDPDDPHSGARPRKTV